MISGEASRKAKAKLAHMARLAVALETPSQSTLAAVGGGGGGLGLGLGLMIDERLLEDDGYDDDDEDDDDDEAGISRGGAAGTKGMLQFGAEGMEYTALEVWN